YDVTRKSNLNELTRINASIVVNNNEHSGFTSNTTVGPDGSFRFRIPKPEIKKIDDSEVMIKIEATSEGAIETEKYMESMAESLKANLRKKQNVVKKLNISFK